MFDFNENNGSNESEVVVSETKVISILDQQSAHHSRSEKYLVIPTREVLDVFEEMGFSYNEETLWKVNSRKQSRKGLGKHMITLRHPELQFDVSLRNELVPQLYLWNSYDGSIRLKIVIGFFRHVCSNTMAFGSGIIDPIVFKHVSGMNNKEFRKKKLMETIKSAAQKFNEVSQYVLKLKEVNLSHQQKLDFARRMVEIRFLGKNSTETLESKGIEITNKILEQYILNPNRREDIGDSAWLVANVVQENLLSPDNYAEFSYRKTYVNKKNETVSKEKVIRKLKSKSRIDDINVSLFEELSKVTENYIQNAA